MAHKILMPKWGLTMEKGIIVEWLKKEGDQVEEGEELLEIESEKAINMVESPASGVLARIIHPNGSEVPITKVIAIITEPGEDISDLPDEDVGKKPKPETEPVQVKVPDSPSTPSRPGVIRAVPLARRLARENGLDLASLTGSGPNGTITKRDVESILAGSQAVKPLERVEAAAVIPEAEYESIPLTSMRNVIARRLVESKAPVPHFYVTSEIDMGPAMELRASLNSMLEEEGGQKVSLNDMIVKASALALRKLPQVNSSFQGDEIRRYNHVHIGIAVSLEDGLITPVLRNCETKSLVQISVETGDLAGRARERRLKPDEYTGATFTVSNMGMMEVENFAAIINPPEGAILAVGSIAKTPVVVGDEIKIGQRMKVTISCDHRVIDGAVGATFLMELKKKLEKPLILLTN